MKWGVVLVVLVAVLAAPAQASAPTLNSLQRQVAALRQTVQVLSQQQGRVTDSIQANQDYTICLHAQNQDIINLVWHVLNVDLAYQGFQAQPDLPRYDDGGACARRNMTRIR